METNPNGPTRHSLAETLDSVLSSSDEAGLSIGELTETVGEKGFGLLLSMLALPSALPVPAIGFGTPFGIAILIVASQMLVGRHTVWLPEKIKNVRMRPVSVKRAIRAIKGSLRIIERLIKPRQKWMRSRMGQTVLAAVIILMAGLMILPIPLTNTLPAIVVFMIGIGLSEEDGWLATAACGAGVLAFGFYVGLLYLMFA